MPNHSETGENDVSAVNNHHQKIQGLVDVNELSTSTNTPFIAAVEHSEVRWGEKYILPDGKFLRDDGSPLPRKKCQEISALEAVSKGLFAGDIRPKMFDKISKTWTLLDSGSVVSCIPRKPDDVIDPKVQLRSVNGSPIATFGTEEIEVKLGRKPYKIKVIKAEVSQRILGWDFFKKHKLNLEWGEFDDLFVVDRKAKIRSLLKCFEDPQHIRINAVDSYQEPNFQEPSVQALQFQMQCMQALGEGTSSDQTFADQVCAMTIDPESPSPIADNLPLSEEVDPDSNKAYKINLEALDKLQEPYKSLVKKFDILKADFKKEPTTDIYHRIETSGESFKSKVRPLLASSEKFKLGKKIWEEMQKLGVIERVKQNTTLQYTSPIHMVKKPSGDSYRVCADFRLLNAITKVDNYPLPLLRSFQGQIKESSVFQTGFDICLPPSANPPR